MDECITCASKYTKTMRFKTICNKCNFECCKQCISRNIKSNGFYCGMCKEEYSPIFISNIFSKPVIKKKYMESMKDKLLEKELKLMTETKKKLLIKQKKEEITKLMEESIISIGLIVKPLYEQKLLNISSSCFKDCFYPNCNGIMYKDDDEKYFKCEKCNKYGCEDCEDICENTKDHICDIVKLKEVEDIKKDTKPCPNCGDYIFKVDGCSQIMCAKCKTFFDFNTGLEDKKDEPRHAKDYIELPNIFEKQIIGEKRWNLFEEKIRVCKDWDLWETDPEKNKYYHIIHSNSTIKETCASIVNSKCYIRKMLTNYVDAFKINEINRIKYINSCKDNRKITKIVAEKEFENLTMHYYFVAYCHKHLMEQTVIYFFSLKELLHTYIQSIDKKTYRVNLANERKLVKDINVLKVNTGPIFKSFNNRIIHIKRFCSSSIMP